jgi:hypothetical protein
MLEEAELEEELEGVFDRLGIGYLDDLNDGPYTPARSSWSHAPVNSVSASTT